MHFVCADGNPNHEEYIHSAAHSLRSAGHTFDWHAGPVETIGEWQSRIGGADGILLLLRLPEEALRRCQRLRVISFAGSGVHRYVDVRAAQQRDVLVCNVPAYGSNAVAEHALALMLAAARGITAGDYLVRQGQWQQSEAVELLGATLGVIGAGPIGTRMLALGRALGMRTLAWTRFPSPDRARACGTEFVPLEQLMSESDFVSLHLAHTKETENIISKERLMLLKRGAILVNTARAELIDMPALTKLLATGHLRGAGIDVFLQEPPPHDDSILRVKSAVLSPHQAYETATANAELYRIAVQNLESFASGTPRNVVSIGGTDR
jgi:phosphoglycerate dehydrogenase-like enzyme